MELLELLKTNKCFKLICGAGNDNLAEVEKLVALYAVAGCRFFDVSANAKVLEAAKRGLSYVVDKECQGKYYFCVSITAGGDPHANKALIDKAKCEACNECLSVCHQGAINDAHVVQQASCVGCLKCVELCKRQAISVYNKENDYENILPELIKGGIDCIELHAQNSSEEETVEIWEYLNKVYDGILSVCVSRASLGDKQLIERLKKLLGARKGFSTIIQTDGVPISGGVDEYGATLQAVSTAQIVQRALLPAFVILSGGTNSKTKELAGLCNVPINGVAFGSYARKIVKPYLDCEDFLRNKVVFDQAVKVAKNLVDKVVLAN